MDKKKTILMVGIIVIFLAVGVSFAYFIANTNTGIGVGNTVNDTTTKVKDTILKSEEFITHNDSNIYPGHKSVSAIKVTATGVNETLFNITWTGTNSTDTSYNYTIYKTTSAQNPTFNCEVKQELVEGVGNTYHEECIGDLTSLGSALKSGTIKATSQNQTIKLLYNQKLPATEEGAVVYYYIVFEYPNIQTNQSDSGTLNGTINTEVIQEPYNPIKTMDEILAEYNTSTRSSFSTVYTEETSNTVFIAEDDYGTSKYFAGAPTDNYVKFGGFYWRIIRLNGDKTTRLIYAGNASTIDALPNKQEVLANGYDDSSTGYTNGRTSILFNSGGNDNAYVGFKYTIGELRGTSTKSEVLYYLDPWYEDNLKTNYGQYLAGNTGFCGDRTPYTSVSGETLGSGINNAYTIYKPLIRLFKNENVSNAAPSLICPNQGDLYTTSSSAQGNKSLANPVGLISADEVAFAGGVAGLNNKSYYLYTNNHYWTMSPAHFNGSVTVVFNVHESGAIQYYLTGYRSSIRPVINLASTTRFTGSGTWDEPYEVVPV